MTDGKSSRTAPSPVLGRVALGVSILPVVLAGLIMTLGLEIHNLPQDSGLRTGAFAISLIGFVSLVPALAALVLGINAIVTSRPRWLGIVATSLSPTPVIALIVAIWLANT